MSHDAFISYSTHDKASADATCAALEASGVRCWIAPRDITPGAEWGEAIIDAINHCRVLILIFSASANESPQIRREVERAVSKGTPVIPLRIQDIAPTRSLEYFIGTVHWLDALTPPLEFHLRRLVEAVKALLQIHPTPPRIVPPSIASTSPASASWIGLKWRMVATAVLTCVGLTAALVGMWWFVVGKTPRPQAASSVPTLSQPPAQPAKAIVDPVLVGTFEHDAVVDDYDWHFIYSIASDGTYRVVTIQEEAGTYHAANGVYHTTGAKTGRVRTGTYRAVGSAGIEVTSANGAATFRSTHPTTIDQVHPVMLGTWSATVVQGGMTWTLEIQNNPDGTYHYQGRTEDHGSCVMANQRWRTTSAVTGQSNTGTYRAVDARSVEIAGPQGVIAWQRR
jgi:hypothetical protein